MSDFIEVSKEKLDVLQKQNRYLLEKITELEKAKTEDEWVDSKEAAKILKITTRTLANYRYNSYIPYTQSYTKYLYKKADLVKYLEQDYK